MGGYFTSRRPAFDLGYFMSQSVPTELRRSREKNVLAQYHAALEREGVTNYDFETCMLDYRRSILYCLAYPVVVCGSLDASTESARAFGMSYLSRSLAAIEDWNCEELLES